MGQKRKKIVISYPGPRSIQSPPVVEGGQFLLDPCGVDEYQETTGTWDIARQASAEPAYHCHG